MRISFKIIAVAIFVTSAFLFAEESSNTRRINAENNTRQITINMMDTELQQNLQNINTRFTTGRTSSRNPDALIIIPTEKNKLVEISGIDEDMNIMSQIFKDEIIKKTIIAPVSNGRLVTGLSANSGYTPVVSCMYLQDYGALFQIKVGFALSVPSETQKQPEKTNQESTDKVWERTKQQIYQRQAASNNSYMGRLENNDLQFNAQKVEILKECLISTLKHASNIRALKPDQSVIIRVSVNERAVRSLNMLQTQESLLIRAQKSDIDAYAKGELDLDKFREKILIFSYRQ